MAQKTKYDLTSLEETLRNGSERAREFYTELLRRSEIAGSVRSAAFGVLAIGAAGTINPQILSSFTDMLIIGGSVGWITVGSNVEHYKNKYLRRFAERIGEFTENGSR